MDLKGRLHNITRDLMSGEFFVTYRVASIPSGMDSLQDRDLAIEVKPYRDKRSKSANAYYWELVGKMAALLGASRPFIHNMLLRDYGTLEEVAGENVEVWLPEDPQVHMLVLESADYHYAPTSLSKTVDGKLYHKFLVIKGSSRYDTAEMARLIDGAVSEAKQMDIDTLPPDELERMMKAYEEHIAGRR